MLVVVEICAEPVVGNKQIGPAIVIVVGGPYRKILPFRLVDLRLGGDVGESSVSIIMVERIGAALVNTGRATALHSTQVAISPVTQIDVTADV